MHDRLSRRDGLDAERGADRDEQTPERAHGVPGRRPRTAGLLFRSAITATIEVDAEAAVDRAAGSIGAPLPAGLRRRLERALGVDLSRIRLHTGAASADAARAVGAHAYTIGDDIHFGAGQYDPDSRTGEHLIAHEVAHTVQAPSATVSSARSLEVSTPGDELEREADQFADAFVAGRPAPVSPAALPGGPTLMRNAMPGHARGVVFEGVKLTSNRASLRALLEQRTVTSGYAEAQLFAGRFTMLSWDQVVKLQFSNVGITKEDVEQVQQAMRDELFAFQADSRKFLAEFETKATQATRDLLDHSKQEIEKELQHYQIQTEKIRAPGGSATLHQAKDQDSTKKLQQAASTLAVERKAADVVSRQYAALNQRISERKAEDPFELTLGADLTAAREMRKRWVESEQRYQKLAADQNKTFPILSAYATGPDAAARLAALAAAPPAQLGQELGEECHKRLKNIEEVRAELGGRFKVWGQSHILASTQRTMNASPLQSRLVRDHAAQETRLAAIKRDAEEKLFMCVALGLGLLASVPTGGSSLLMAIAAVAATGSLVLSAYTAYDHLAEYNLEHAANGTAFDKAHCISQEEPSMLGLALDIVAVIADLHGAMAAFKALSAAIKAKDLARLTATARNLLPPTGAERIVLNAAKQAGGDELIKLGQRLGCRPEDLSRVTEALALRQAGQLDEAEKILVELRGRLGPEQIAKLQKQFGMIGCFVAGTAVAGPLGPRPIEHLDRGDRVLAYDLETGAVTEREVVAAMRHQVASLVVLELGAVRIECSAEHPFWVLGDGWRDAGSLAVGMELLGKHGAPVAITAVTRREGWFEVHNLEVAGEHDYFVSDAAVLVHNKSAMVSPHELVHEVRSQSGKLLRELTDYERRLAKLEVEADKALAAGGDAAVLRVNQEVRRLGEELEQIEKLLPHCRGDLQLLEQLLRDYSPAELEQLFKELGPHLETTLFSAEAGSPLHKKQRWADYQARGGSWSYDRWSKVYDLNATRATKAHAAADAYHAQAGWGKREVTVDVDGVDRRLDIGDKKHRRGVEVKTGKQYATQDNLWELERDRILVDEKGWQIQWHFTEEPSGPLKDALKKANIPYTVGPI